MDLEFFEDPAAFLAVAGEHLAAEPVVNTVVATVAEREARESAVRKSSQVTLPGGPHRGSTAGGPRTGTPSRATPARWWASRCGPRRSSRTPCSCCRCRRRRRCCWPRSCTPGARRSAGANGALPATRTFADETARLAGGGVRVSMHTRLFELGELTPPPSPSGRLRPVTEDEAGLALEWFNAFHRDADEQAGRPPGDGHAGEDGFDLDDMLVRIRGERVWFWDDDGPVHLTGANDPAYGVARVGPVYTPKENRGRGYAGAGVAEVSRRILATGSRACLFTDQANPTSNRLYESLGYRPVVDMANLRVEAPGE